jgi:hypothetical protein
MVFVRPPSECQDFTRSLYELLLLNPLQLISTSLYSLSADRTVTYPTEPTSNPYADRPYAKYDVYVCVSGGQCGQ